MRALTLNFIRTPRSRPWLGMALLIVGALAVAQVVNYERALVDQIELANARLDVLTKGSQVKPSQPVNAEEQAQEIRRANEILQQLAMPWRALFHAVEDSSDKEIALLSIQPDAGKRVLRLAGEAKNFDALVAFIARLERSPILSQVYLSSHELRLQDPQQPVRFALVANWTVQP